MAHTNTNIVIVDSCISDGSLSWDFVSEDNGDPNCYLVGTAYYARLYKSPLSLDPCTFSTNAHLNCDSEQTEVIEDEIVTFTGDQEASLTYPAYTDITITLIGDAYGGSCAMFPSLTFSFNRGTNKITCSVPCYAVLQVSYTTQYDRYVFVPKSAGTLMLGAIDTYEDDEVTATTTIEAFDSCADEDLCLNITSIIDTETEEGANYQHENKKLIRVYGAEAADIIVRATKGSLTFLGPAEEEIEEELTVCDGNVSTSKWIYKLTEQTITTGNLNEFYVEKGNLVMIRNVDDEAVNDVPKGYGSVKIKYKTRFLKYLISAATPGYGVFLVIDNSDTTCGILCLPYQIGELEADKVYDITVTYRDFVTGAPIAEANVWLEGKHVGETNEVGEIRINAVPVGVAQRIKAEKPGYLNTDSDSLANDTFIIPDN